MAEGNVAISPWRCETCGHEKRRADGAPQESTGGTIWLTPREVALGTLRRLGEETESLYWPFKKRDGGAAGGRS